MKCTVEQAVIYCWFLLLIITSTASNYTAPNENSFQEKLEDGTFIEASDAKSFLKPRRKRFVGWLVAALAVGGTAIIGSSIAAERVEEESEAWAAENREESREDTVTSCRNSCWGSWGSWSQCSVQCGSSGTQTKRRDVSKSYGCSDIIDRYGCPGSSSVTKSCGRPCHNGGTLRSSYCSCPHGYKGTCCETRVRCGFPGKPVNGATSPPGNTLYYGASARFSCNEGYYLIGSSARTCQQSGSWSGSVPECRIRNCGDPGTPKNGGRRVTKFEVSDTVVFSCDTGYRLTGSHSSINCLSNGKWNGPVPTCTIVSCEPLRKPEHGHLQMTGSTYMSIATVACDMGWYIRGSSQRRCLANGRWDGTPPSCHLITCGTLAPPSNGTVTVIPDDNSIDSEATYACEYEYQLHGLNTRLCQLVSGSSTEAEWTGERPTCQLIDCGDPGFPPNGLWTGGVTTYGAMLSYACAPGYVLSGSDTLKCLVSGWDKDKPSCIACGLNEYNSETDSSTECSTCTDHSHTVSVASANVKQCLCDDQFRGQPGGPCTKITCPVIPEGRAYEDVEGIVESCSNDIGDECHFLCNPGHVRARGSATVTCLLDGSWSGGWPPNCTACPLSTFKTEETMCTRCPENSGTNTTGASAVEECDCLYGYASHSDEFCHDVDECLEDNGGCQQTCSNLPGGYVCQCTRPGYEQNTTDTSKCIRNKTCIELQPPENGGLVCHMEAHTSTTRCTVKCNPGFEFMIRTNQYNECGPATNWLWSHEEAGLSPAEYLPCVPQFYPSVTLEAEVAYFVENCDDFDEAGTKKVQDEFLQMLQESGICLRQGEGQDVCRVDDVQIRCSYTEESPTRFRRAVERRAEVRIKFNLKAIEATKNESKCATQCGNAVVLKQLCLQDCSDQFQQERSSAVKARAKQLGDMLSSSQIAMSDVFPSQSMRYTQRTAKVSCANDMISSNGFCVPCPAGSFVNSRQDECIGNSSQSEELPESPLVTPLEWENLEFNDDVIEFLPLPSDTVDDLKTTAQPSFEQTVTLSEQSSGDESSGDESASGEAQSGDNEMETFPRAFDKESGDGDGDHFRDRDTVVETTMPPVYSSLANVTNPFVLLFDQDLNDTEEVGENAD